MIELGQLLLDFIVLVGHFVVHQRDFNNLQAADTLFGADHFFDQISFDRIGGLVDRRVLVNNLLK